MEFHQNRKIVLRGKDFNSVESRTDVRSRDHLVESDTLRSKLVWSDLETPLVLDAPAEPEREIGKVAQYLVTCVLRNGPATLEAEWTGQAPVIWHLLKRNGEKTDIYRSENLSIFRAVLARFGGFYMDMQLYGGYVQRVLRLGDAGWMTRIYMSNTGASGYWIRMYAMHDLRAH